LEQKTKSKVGCYECIDIHPLLIDGHEQLKQGH
jgi:hypothetical protein